MRDSFRYLLTIYLTLFAQYLLVKASPDVEPAPNNLPGSRLIVANFRTLLI